MRPLRSCLALLGLVFAAVAPVRAQLVVTPGGVSVTLPQGEVVERMVMVTNVGAEPASFCLSFDRPLQRQGDGARLDAGGGPCGEPGELLFSVDDEDFGSAWRPYGITMTPDGSLFAAENSPLHRTFELAPGLEIVRWFSHPKVAELSAFAQTVGVAYNADTGTLWWTNAEVSGHDIRRVMLLEGDLDGKPTGRRVVLPLVPAPPPNPNGYPKGASYDPATGLFYYVDGLNDTLWAIDTLGVVPEGYPVEQTAYPGVPLSNGLDAHSGAEGGVEGVRLEVAVALGPGGGVWDRVVVLDRFGGDLGGPSGSETPLPDFQGGTGGGGMTGNPLRSRVDPNGVMYASFSNFDTEGVAAVRPAPLAPSWLAVSQWSGTLGPGESAEVALTFSAGQREPGDYTAALQVIEAASGAVTEVPLVLTVTQGTAVEPGPGTAAIRLSVYPNPSRGRFFVEAEADEVAVYDVLGRVVRRFALTEGRAVVSVAGLPAGVYVVRLGAGEGEAARTVTVMR